MIVGSNDVAHAANVRVIYEGYDRSFASCADFFRMIGALSFLGGSMFIGGDSGNNLDSNLIINRVSYGDMINGMS